MKKYLHPKYLPILVPIASVLGLLLRLWTMGGGPDESGLYAPQPLAWVLLWMVSIVTLAGIVFLSNGLKNPGRYSDNFPPSVISAAGCGAAALAIVFSSLTTLVGAVDLLATITGILGLVSAVALVLVALARYQGKKPSFLMHTVICLFLALRVFDRCKHWSNVTQTGVFLFQFLASICVMLAAYQLCCFDVNLGNRRRSLFWNLATVYFCALALPMGEEPLFYGGMLLWMISNLCSVRPIKAAKAQGTDSEEPNPEPAEETAETPAEKSVPELAEEPELASYADILEQLGKE